MTTSSGGFFSTGATRLMDANASSRNIITAYRTAYAEFYGREAGDCHHRGGDWYIINGIPREFSWVTEETERLREGAHRRAKENHEPSTKINLLRLIRKLSKL